MPARLSDLDTSSSSLTVTPHRASTSLSISTASPDDVSSESPDSGDGSSQFFSPVSDFPRSQQMDLMSPKIEELDDDDLQNIKSATVETVSGASVAVPRKRGRPRKHPLPTPGAQVKVTKGRSKTGCITCRRRKKKCDETKPACLNCQKNAVVCEGYPPKEIWKSGRQKQANGQSVLDQMVSILFLTFLLQLGLIPSSPCHATCPSLSTVLRPTSTAAFSTTSSTASVAC